MNLAPQPLASQIAVVIATGRRPERCVVSF